MVASRETIEQVYIVMCRYVFPMQMKDMLLDLMAIEGNQSFKETVKALQERHNQELEEKERKRNAHLPKK